MPISAIKRKGVIEQRVRMHVRCVHTWYCIVYLWDLYYSSTLYVLSSWEATRKGVSSCHKTVDRVRTQH